VLLGLGVTADPALSHIESFRGRRGWHLVFHYQIETTAEALSTLPCAWFTPDVFPRTAHGTWEANNARRVLSA
jgi:hypothetical protein